MRAFPVTRHAHILKEITRLLVHTRALTVTRRNTAASRQVIYLDNAFRLVLRVHPRQRRRSPRVRAVAPLRVSSPRTMGRKKETKANSRSLPQPIEFWCSRACVRRSAFGVN